MSAIVSYSSIGVSELGTELGKHHLSWSGQVQAAASFLNEVGSLFIELKSETATIFKANLIEDIEFIKAGPGRQICTVKDAGKAEGRTFCFIFASEVESKGFSEDVKAWRNMAHGMTALDTSKNPYGGGNYSDAKNKFERKIEPASAKMYFHYYGQLLHQQNMLQDYVRTGSYFAAVIENKVDFEGRVVVDVGAGSGILSLFAAQAGAKHVYAIEASPMAEYARRLVKGNPGLAERITVVHGKVEEVQLPEKADVLISEPMGTLLVNERMLESYVIARDNFLKKGGKMFPALGRIHMAPFSDEYLYVEIANKALFWQQQNFYGVDLTPLQSSAFQGFFAQPVVDAFDPRLLLSSSTSHTIDFTSIQEEELYDIDIPLSFTANMPARLHGLACWFDVLFDGSNVQRWLSTAPGAPTTHWYQLRCLLSQPLHVLPGQQITGRLHLASHSNQSYNITLTLSTMSWPGPGGVSIPIQTSTSHMDLKEPYYRMSSVSTAAAAAAYGNNSMQQQQPQEQAYAGTTSTEEAMVMAAQEQEHTHAPPLPPGAPQAHAQAQAMHAPAGDSIATATVKPTAGLVSSSTAVSSVVSQPLHSSAADQQQQQHASYTTYTIGDSHHGGGSTSSSINGNQQSFMGMQQGNGHGYAIAMSMGPMDNQQ